MEEEFLRLKWNITGTSLAGSADDGSVSVWQRSINPENFVYIAHLVSK